MPNKTKVATFVRVSNHTNSEQALANQKRMLDEYCQAQGYEIEDTAVMVGDKHLGYEMFLKLIDEAEEKGYEKIVIASANRVAATLEEIKAIKEHLEGKKVHIETKDGTIVLFDYADADESPEDMSFGLTIQYKIKKLFQNLLTNSEKGVYYNDLTVHS